MSDNLSFKAPSPVLHAIKRLVADDLRVERGADLAQDHGSKLVLTPALRVVPGRFADAAPLGEVAREAGADLLVLTPALAVPSEGAAGCGEDAILEIDQADLRAIVAEMVRAELSAPSQSGVGPAIRQLIRDEVARALQGAGVGGAGVGLGVLNRADL